jgi:hypothetical protein
MKPLKSARGLVNWLLRISLSAYFIFKSVPVVLYVDLDSAGFYIALLQLVFATLLFIGGFLSKHTLTIIAGLGLFVFGIYLIFSGWTSKLDTALFLSMLISATSFYFVSNGNRN